MIKVGLTGSIGSGKSTLAKHATNLGIPVFDADKVVHRLYAEDADLKEFLAERCGNDVLTDGVVDRARLNAFRLLPDNDRTWRMIEAEVGKRVWEKFDDFSKEQESMGRDILIADVPFLFEMGSEKRFDYTINVFADAEVQKKRALERSVPKLTEQDFEKRLAAFMPLKERNAKADFTIDNTGEIEAGVLQLRYYLNKMKSDKDKTRKIKAEYNESAVYVGSFDPMTLGHVDVVKSAAHMPYKKIYVAVGVNPSKKPMFTTEERIKMIEREMDRDIRPYLPEGREIIVTSYEGLTVDFMKQVGASLCIRGLRGIKDLEEENDLAAVNKGLYDEDTEDGGLDQFVQAYFATSDPELRHVSSSFARGICLMGANRDLSLLKYVSADIAAKMILKRDGQKAQPT